MNVSLSFVINIVYVRTFGSVVTPLPTEEEVSRSVPGIVLGFFLSTINYLMVRLYRVQQKGTAQTSGHIPHT